jgi:hypothetical protein
VLSDVDAEIVDVRSPLLSLVDKDEVNVLSLVDFELVPEDDDIC